MSSLHISRSTRNTNQFVVVLNDNESVQEFPFDQGYAALQYAKANPNMPMVPRIVKKSTYVRKSAQPAAPFVPAA